jgi:hypothetical protein
MKHSKHIGTYMVSKSRPGSATRKSAPSGATPYHPEQRLASSANWLAWHAGRAGTGARTKPTPLPPIWTVKPSTKREKLKKAREARKEK